MFPSDSSDRDRDGEPLGTHPRVDSLDPGFATARWRAGARVQRTRWQQARCAAYVRRLCVLRQPRSQLDRLEVRL